ncbi:hypothetical protein [Streptomyces xiamenensis]|uniref:hypothetical protein n=1 Tax=Streptomyces xiamenensis TaxID=408015 RepID=UPI0037D1F273
MRNADIITHINTQLVAHLQRLGVRVTPLTLDELAAASREHRCATLAYSKAASGTGAEEAMAPQEAPPLTNPGVPKGEEVYGLTAMDKAFLDGESFGLDEILSDFDSYIHSSLKPLDQVNQSYEDETLAMIPSRYRPGSAKERRRLEDALEAAYYAEGLETRNVDAIDVPPRDALSRMFGDKVAQQWVPEGFEPQGQTEQERDAERRLAGWAALRSSRDSLVQQARRAGVTKSRIAELTGLARTTIDRILGSTPPQS